MFPSLAAEGKPSGDVPCWPITVDGNPECLPRNVACGTLVSFDTFPIYCWKYIARIVQPIGELRRALAIRFRTESYQAEGGSPLVRRQGGVSPPPPSETGPSLKVGYLSATVMGSREDEAEKHKTVMGKRQGKRHP